LQEKELGGARKRSSAAFSADDDDDDNDDEEFSDSSEAEEDSKMPPKKPPTPRKTKPSAQAPGQPAAAAAKKTVPIIDTDIKTIIENISKLNLDHANCWGWSYMHMTPFHYWAFKLQGQRYLKLEILSWTTFPDDIIARVVNNGTRLEFKNKIPDVVYNMRRIHAQYHNSIADGEDCMVINTADEFFGEIHEAACQEPIKPGLKIPLPFLCRKDFFDPYCEEFLTKLLRLPHERDPNRKVYLYQVNLVDINVPQRRVENVEEEIDMNFDGAEDDGDDEDM